MHAIKMNGIKVAPRVTTFTLNSVKVNIFFLFLNDKSFHRFIYCVFVRHNRVDKGSKN